MYMVPLFFNFYDANIRQFIESERGPEDKKILAGDI